MSRWRRERAGTAEIHERQIHYLSYSRASLLAHT